ncbi:DUF4377 domain-containing protein [Longimicrobium sp.]|uniref:DUF4377 domain-containing protein n=1 Tax=Longimicrobium sp. TaxID=2029185 RepID=UPI002E372D54|nr:DUF4377 domain-containing protein [Longimicrobium sp.]HEX6036465.1 DUF4377 domain-containing protein [Longimicrobium sp.]
MFALALLPACGAAPTGAGEQQLTLYVASYTRTCTGTYEMQCLQIRDDSADPWGNFHGEIEGFTYEPGHEYVLRVRVTEIANPPADGSSRRYQLVQVVSKTPA